VGRLMDEALAAGTAICSMSLPSILMAKECINRAFETPLAEGIRFERRLFHALFATRDQKEGMEAFLEKRRLASRTNDWPAGLCPHADECPGASRRMNACRALHRKTFCNRAGTFKKLRPKTISGDRNADSR